MLEWNPSMPASRRSVFIVIRLMRVLKKHKRMFLILFIVFAIGNGSTAPSRISHLLKWKKLHNRSLSAYSSHFFGQKPRVNYFRASINGQAFFSLRVDGNSEILPEWTFLKKLSKKCVSDIDFIPTMNYSGIVISFKILVLIVFFVKFYHIIFFMIRSQNFSFDKLQVQVSHLAK